MADEHPYAKSMGLARELSKMLGSRTATADQIRELGARHRAAMDEDFAAHPAGQKNAYGPPVSPEE